MFKRIRGLFNTLSALFLTGFFSVLALVSLVVKPNGSIARYIAYRAWPGTLLFVCGIKVERIGAEKLKKNEAYVYVSSHSSLLDIPVIFISLPHFAAMVTKKELFRLPFFGAAMRRAGCIEIDRSNSASAIETLNRNAEKIKSGMSVCIFPEGTRSRDGVLKEFKKGAFVMAQAARAVIVPIIVEGTHEALPSKKFLMKSGKTKVYVLDFITIPPQAPQGEEALKAERDELMRRTRAVMVEFQNKIKTEKTEKNG